MKKTASALLPLLLALLASGCSSKPAASSEDGFVSLFNGKDLTGWKVPEGDNGHWKATRGVIDYDALSEAPGEKHLWSEKDYRDFTLKLDWKIKRTTGFYDMPVVLTDGTYELGPDGQPIKHARPNADSGVYLRGVSKAQVNIWCWPIGSGEVYGYRNDKNQPPSVRAGVTPSVRADKPVGQWNTFEITMRGEYLTVVLNDIPVIENARLPGIPASGPIALQHHGGMRNGEYSPASSLMQFRNISIKEL